MREADVGERIRRTKAASGPSTVLVVAENHLEHPLIYGYINVWGACA